MRCLRPLLMLGLVTVGCGGLADDAAGGDIDTDAFEDEMPDDLPAGNCGEDDPDETCDTDGDSSGVGGTTGPVESDCLVDGCAGQGVCAAEWDPQTEQRGAFECRFACIPLLDDSSWCSDDEACCDAAARCTARGYCVLDDDDGTTSGDGSTGGDDSGSSSEGSTGGDESGSSSGGTSTGGAT